MLARTEVTSVAVPRRVKATSGRRRGRQPWCRQPPSAPTWRSAAPVSTCAAGS